MFYPVKFIISVHLEEIEAFEAFGENIDQDWNKGQSFELHLMTVKDLNIQFTKGNISESYLLPNSRWFPGLKTNNNHKQNSLSHENYCVQIWSGWQTSHYRDIRLWVALGVRIPGISRLQKLHFQLEKLFW